MSDFKKRVNLKSSAEFTRTEVVKLLEIRQFAICFRWIKANFIDLLNELTFDLPIVALDRFRLTFQIDSINLTSYTPLEYLKLWL